MASEYTKTFIEAFIAEWNRLAADRSAGQADVRRQLDAVERKLAGLIDAIADGLRAPGLQAKLEGLERA